MNKKQTHLEFIQSTITRLASDSFLMKGWGVTLVAAQFAFLAETETTTIAPVIFAPILCFWGLDGFFLWKERLFRQLYDDVRTRAEHHVDLSMDVSSLAATGTGTWLAAVFSRTLVSFYGVLALAAGLALYLRSST